MASKDITIRNDANERYHMQNRFIVVYSNLVMMGYFNWTVQYTKSNNRKYLGFRPSFLCSPLRKRIIRIYGKFDRNEEERHEHKIQGKKLQKEEE
jgi:hypothetical protein